jgi:DNA-binding FadR family transcriptional regulator
MLEAEAAGLAATRATEPQLAAIQRALRDFIDTCQSGGDTADADTALHTTIAQATNNRYLYDTLSHLGRHFMPRTRLLTAKLSRDAPSVFVERVMREHEDIVSAIARRDPESARAAMRTHLANSRERVRRASENL